MVKSTLARKLAAISKALEKEYGRPGVKKQAEPLGPLVATILSQNTTDRNSGRAYAALRQAYPGWDDVLRAGAVRVAGRIRCGGLARQKSERIIGLLRELKRQRGSLSLRFLHRMPTGRAVEWLTGFKGIGLKTACVVLAFACAREIFPVDTHVARLALRLGLVPPGSDADRTHYLLDPLIPGRDKLSLHLNLIRHGREVCRAGRPYCSSCRLRRWCSYYAGRPATGRRRT